MSDILLISTLCEKYQWIFFSKLYISLQFLINHDLIMACIDYLLMYKEMKKYHILYLDANQLWRDLVELNFLYHPRLTYMCTNHFNNPITDAVIFFVWKKNTDIDMKLKWIILLSIQIFIKVYLQCVANNQQNVLLTQLIK